MASWIDALISILLAIVQIAVGVGLALFSVTIALNLLNRLTKGLDELSELRKGNIVVGLLHLNIPMCIV